MARGLIAGGTDYSRQGFEDMVSDLKNWLVSLSETIDIFSKGVAKLRESQTWDSMSDDMELLVIQSLQFYETTYQELVEILQEIQTEVQNHHIFRLRSLSSTAGKLNSDYGQIWHSSYTRGDRRHPDYHTIEIFYTEGRNMAADLIDVGNLASRLQDFIGRKQRTKSSSDDEEEKHKKELISTYKKRLRILELQAARSGSSVEPQIVIEIEEIKAKIKELEA